MDLNKYLVDIDAPLLEVLKKIDALHTSQTVFVINKEGSIIATVTDGDIRRGLIKGYKIEDPLQKFMFRDFSFLQEGTNNFNKLKEFRDKKLKVVPLVSKEGKLVKIYDFTVTKSILPVDAVIMAGGLGKRLKPLTDTTPKPLLKVGTKEIIAYNFDRLFQFGIDNQFVVVNYLKEQLIDFCRSYNKQINFNIICENEYLGTAGALSLIDINRFKNDTVLLMNSDLLTNIDYEDFYQSFVEKGADAMVASVPYRVNLPYAIFNTQDRKVTSFKEKPEYTYYANAGIYLVKKELLSFIPENSFYNATDFMEHIILKGKQLIHYPVRGYWLDIGKYDDYEKAQKDIAHINW